MKRDHCLALGIAILILLPTARAGEIPMAPPEEVGFSSQRLERIDSIMQAYVDEGKLAGIITLVARRGKIVHLKEFGKKDLNTGSKMTADTIFRIYSMTKPITTVAAMTLYEKGRFHLTDPVADYIPELKEVKVLVGDSNGGVESVTPDRPVQIRDLMTHTAGFTYGVFSNTFVDQSYREAEVFSPDSTLKDMIGKIAELPLLYRPGTRWHYGVSTDVLGYLVEIVSGMPLDRFFQERIFQPLDMRDTAFSVTDDKLGRFATCYGPADDNSSESKLKVVDEPASSRYLAPVKMLSGGGGLVSTTRDYLRFLQMLLNGGELDGARILSRKTVDLMAENHLRGELLNLEASGGYGFGLGFAVLMDVPRSGLVGSEGEYNWGGYASTLFWVDPEEELIAILMTQFIPSGTYPLRRDFKAAVYQALVE